MKKLFFREPDEAEAHDSMSNERGPGSVEVSLMQHPNGTYFLQVAVRSIVKPGLMTQAGLDVRQQSNHRLRVAYAAGACAEQLCKKYRDVLDPEQCSLVALEVFDALKIDVKQKHGLDL